jgi:hypothetical protein
MKSISTVPLLISATALAAATTEGVVMTLRRQSYDWRAYFASLGNAVVRRGMHALMQALPFGLATSLLGLAWNHRLFDIPLRHAG